MKSRRDLLSRSVIALVWGLGLANGADDVGKGEENYQLLFQEWQAVVRAAVTKGQSVLVFVDGAKRKTLAASAHLHLALLRKKLANDAFVCLVLSGNERLAAPENITKYGLVLGATSSDQQRRWLRLIDDKLQAEKTGK